MDNYINLISVAAGGLLALAGKYITGLFRSSSDNKISLRESLLKRIDQIERRQARTESRLAETEAKMHRWIMRYWSLYRWTLKKYSSGKFESMPPNFHEMDIKDIEGELDKNETSN